MTVKINIQKNTITPIFIPKNLDFRKWIMYVMASENISNIDICLRITNPEEMLDLNSKFRNVSKSTNILTFLYNSSDKVFSKSKKITADIVVCDEVINKEASKYNVSFMVYWAKIIIHGCLHIAGYDHKNNLDEEIMNNKENKTIEALTRFI